MPRHVTVGLHATIVAVTDAEPRVLTVSGGGGDDGFPALPFGPLDPDRHRTLELGLRAWVREQTGMELAHVEQLYTFGDRDRAGAGDGEARVIAVAYLALVRERHVEAGHPAAWEAVYRFLPWEDRRGGEPALLREGIRPALDAWIAAAPPGDPRRERRGRADITFGAGAAPWDAERVLDRSRCSTRRGGRRGAAEVGRRPPRRAASDRQPARRSTPTGAPARPRAEPSAQ
ncbi:MAG: NAD regulator, partial [Acidobacteria bacterium]|nr:NAD regulator [Acidobacteriota bacterium]